jgi:acyl carrier protein
MTLLNDDEIMIQLKQILQEVLRVREEDITPESSYREMGADSLELMTLIMILEDDFKCQISEDAVKELTTVGATIAYIRHNMIAQQE